MSALENIVLKILGLPFGSWDLGRGVLYGAFLAATVASGRRAVGKKIPSPDVQAESKCIFCGVVLESWLYCGLQGSEGSCATH